jgi:FkbM family methyltransferase
MKDSKMGFVQIIRRRIPDKIKSRYQAFRAEIVPSPLDIERAEETFYINYLREGMTVYDVGANIGELTLLFSRFVGQRGRVFSFEASADTFKKLDAVAGFTRRNNIVLSHLALSDKVGSVKLTVYPDEYAGWNSLADRPLESYGINVKPVRYENIACSTVDAFSLEHNISHIDLLKIDVEGAEYQVLLGAQKMLQEKRIGCCVFEFGATTFDMGNTPEMIESFLEKMKYRIRNIITGAKSFPGREGAKYAQYSMHIVEPIKS